MQQTERIINHVPLNSQRMINISHRPCWLVGHKNYMKVKHGQSIIFKELSGIKGDADVDPVHVQQSEKCKLLLIVCWEISLVLTAGWWTPVIFGQSFIFSSRLSLFFTLKSCLLLSRLEPSSTLWSPWTRQSKAKEPTQKKRPHSAQFGTATVPFQGRSPANPVHTANGGKVRQSYSLKNYFQYFQMLVFSIRLWMALGHFKRQHSRPQ